MPIPNQPVNLSPLSPPNYSTVSDPTLEPANALVVHRQGQFPGSDLASFLPSTATPSETSAATTNGSQVAASVPAGGVGIFSYITGVDIVLGGGSVAASQVAQITGLVNPLNIAVAASGFLAALSLRFPRPIRASIANAAITLTLPSVGGPAAANSIIVYGFQM